MSIDTLFYGLEAFDDDVDTAPEDITQEMEEVSEKQQEATEMYYQAKMIGASTQIALEHLDEAIAYRNHIASFGVDRTFLALANRDNRLSNYLGMALPSCESMDSIGNPSSQLSLVCMEAFDNVITKFFHYIWEKICALAKWIKDKIVGFFDWIGSFFSSKEAKDGEKALETAAQNTDKIAQIANEESKSGEASKSGEESKGDVDVLSYDALNALTELAKNNLPDAITKLREVMKTANRGVFSDNAVVSMNNISIDKLTTAYKVIEDLKDKIDKAPDLSTKAVYRLKTGLVTPSEKGSHAKAYSLKEWFAKYKEVMMTYPKLIKQCDPKGFAKDLEDFAANIKSYGERQTTKADPVKGQLHERMKLVHEKCAFTSQLLAKLAEAGSGMRMMALQSKMKLQPYIAKLGK